jgi:hypothetical protein
VFGSFLPVIHRYPLMDSQKEGTIDKAVSAGGEVFFVGHKKKRRTLGKAVRRPHGYVLRPHRVSMFAAGQAQRGEKSSAAQFAAIGSQSLAQRSCAANNPQATLTHGFVSNILFSPRMIFSANPVKKCAEAH